MKTAEKLTVAFTQKTEEPYLMVGEVAGILRVRPMTVYRKVKQGKLKAYRMGRSLRFRRKDVDDFFEKNAVNPMSGEHTPGGIIDEK